MHIPHLATAEEFLLWEEQQQDRYEFAEGAGSVLPGAMPRHEIVLLNLATAVRIAVGAGYVFGSGMKLLIDQTIRYPDIMVGFDERDHIEQPYRRYPTLLIEILSKSTSATDRGPKTDEYRTIETLREYVLIDSRKRWVQTIRRAGNDWIVSLPILGGDVRFESIGLNLTFDEIYAGAQLT
jgi:Uma2 family endonuclease